MVTGLSWKLLLPLLLAAVFAAGMAAAQMGGKSVETEAHIWLGNMRFASSLHATTKGMKYWYERGLGAKIGIPYEKLFCKKCHATCENCHGVKDSEGRVVDFSVEKADKLETCLTCHGREKKAYMLGMENPEYADVHIVGYGFTCTFCHSSLEVHGMYKDFNFMFDKGGVVNITCEHCHLEGLATPPFMTIPEHRVHLKDISCETCHTSTMITCYSCHFSYAYEMYRKTGKPVKKAIPIIGWIPIAKDPRTGKIVPVNFMVVIWDANGTKYVQIDIAKHFPHTVTEEGLRCKDCHGIPAAKTLLKKGVLKVVWLENGTIRHLTGVIPIVNGTKLVFQTFEYDPATGSFKPFLNVTIDVNSHLIENTLPLSIKDLKYMAKSPEELSKGG